MARGLAPIAPNAKTCSVACSNAWRRKWTRAWWAKIKSRRLVAKRVPAETWRCAECGASHFEAERKRERLGLRRLRGNAVVCSPRCAEARELRRYVVRYGHLPRRRRRG